MQILVTGGAGFIGSALARALVTAGHRVVAVDNFNDYYDVALKRARAKTFLTDCELIEGDIRDTDFLTQLFASHTFDVVAHLAGAAGVRFSLSEPLWYLSNNVEATAKLLESMHRHQVSRLVFASTSSVYGNTSIVPFTENQPADRPVSVYAASKRSCELLAHTYFELYGIPATCLRFFTVYGPWSRPDMAMLKFAERMTAGEPIDIYNEGKLRRDFTYIDDIVQGFRLAVEQPFGYEIINLGRGEPVELLSYINELERALGVTALRNLLPMQPGDVFETYADTTKAKELLGFSATVSITDGVNRFVDWYRSYSQG